VGRSVIIILQIMNSERRRLHSFMPMQYQNLFEIFTNTQRVRVLFRWLAGALGALHVYAAIRSQSMNPDGIAYLDIGDAYFRADWANAINAVWSPLYSWILGLVNFIVKPPMQWEFPTVHIVNFFIYLFALACFEFMWCNVRNTNTENESHYLTDPLWWMLGYLLFIWTTLSLIQIWAVTPDMLMAAFVFLAAGLIGRIRAGGDNHRLFLSLGLVLGLGYLSKTFMFCIAPVFLALAWLVQKQTRTSLFKTLLAAGVFILISAPFISLISQAKGKFTIGEAGTVTFLREVMVIPYPHWQGDPQENIYPAHPARVIHASPNLYEFGEPIGGTYPIITDPAYWYEGIPVQISIDDLLIRLFASGIYFLNLFFEKLGIFVACVIVLYLMGQRTKRTFFEIVHQWVLVIPAVVAFGLYGMVLVAGRYVGVFVLLFWADILANIRIPALRNNISWMNVLGEIAALGLIVNIVLFNLDGFTRLTPSLGAGLVESSAPPARPLAVAQMLEESGVQPGDKVGVIGYAHDSFWARLIKVKITTQMLDADAELLWRGDDAMRQSVLQAFADAGVRAVVAEYVPGYAGLRDWHQVDNSSYYIYVFTEQ
jgi:hypothetical protein